MAGTNTPSVSPRLARMGSSGATSGLEAGRAHPVSAHLPSEGHGGGGGNPMQAGFDSEGHQLLPLGRPGTLSGIIGRALDKADVATNNETIDREKGATAARTSQLYDQYMQKLNESGGNTRMALHNLISDPEVGHAIFANPQDFQKILALHQTLSQGENTGLKDLGHGFLSYTDDNGQTKVMQERAQPKGSTAYPGKVMTDRQGNAWFSPSSDPTNLQRMGPHGPTPSNLKYDSQGNVLPPTPGAGQQPATAGQPTEGPGSPVGQPQFGKSPAATGKMTNAEEADVKGVEQFAGALRTYEPVAGSNVAVTGALAHFAPYLPSSMAPQWNALEEAHGQLQSSVTALANSGNLRLKQIANSVMGLVPALGSSQDYAQNYAVPGMRDKLRSAVGALNEDLATKGIAIPPTIAGLTKTIGADPTYLASVNAMRDKMATAPASLSNSDVEILQKDSLDYRTLNKQQRDTLDSQRMWRGYMTPTEVQDKARTDPSFIRVPTQSEDPRNYGTYIDPAITRQAVAAQAQAAKANAAASPLAPAAAPTPPAPQAQPSAPSNFLVPGTDQPPAQPAQQPAPQQATPVPPAMGMAPGAGSPQPTAPAQATAPIPPPTPQAPQPAPASAGQQSFLDQINPIGSALAGEPPPQAPLEVQSPLPPGEAEILAKSPEAMQRADQTKQLPPDARGDRGATAPISQE